jgi:hypothetical protein
MRFSMPLVTACFAMLGFFDPLGTHGSLDSRYRYGHEGFISQGAQ